MKYSSFCIKCNERTVQTLEDNILTCIRCGNKKTMRLKKERGFPGIQTKGLTENLQEGMKDLNKALRGMPHITLGKDLSKELLKTQDNPLFNEKEQKTMSKLKKWGLIGCIILILGYAVYSIIKTFI